MRFYPSLNKETIAAMTAQETKYYLQAMDRLMARERLFAMEASSYPHIQKNEDRRRDHRNVYKSAYPENFENRSLKTTDLELI